MEEDMKSIVMMLVFWIVALGLLAQQPQIEVSIANSLGIPHAYDDVIILPNGNMHF